MTRHFHSITNKLIVLSLIASIMLAGCADPKTYDITKLSEAQNKALAKKLTAEEKQKLAAWMVRNALGGKAPAAGTTVEMALKQQDEWVAQQKEEEAKAEEAKKRIEAESQAQREAFAKVLSVEMLSKINQTQDAGRRWVTLEMSYENKGEKDIQGVKGVLKITDIFGDKILNLKFSYDKGILARQRIVDSTIGFNVNQFDDEDMKFWNKDFDKMKSSFEVSSIIFTDGTRLDASQ